MAQFRKSENPNQALLLPPSPRDWLPSGHLAWFIQDAVAALDIDKLLETYRISGKGELAYPPRVMLQILIYAYCTGTFSSRRIAAQIDDSIAFRVLAAGLQPSHRTISRFREENLDAFSGYFVQVVEIAREAKLVKMGTIAIDGSKVKANASKHKAMSYGRMKTEEQKLRDEIRRITDLARGVDDAEDAQFGPDFRGDELPKELQRREDRVATIRAAKKRLEDAQAEADEDSKRGQAQAQGARGAKIKRPNGVPPDKSQSNFTDPESRIMKAKSGAFEQCFNAQLAVDSHERLIVAADVTQCASDSGELVKMTEAAQTNIGVAPKRVLADAGYRSEANFEALEQCGIQAFVSLGKGETAERDAAAGPRTVQMSARLKSRRGRARYKQRKALVEPVFGWIKQALGFRTFSLRGIAKVRAEWRLVCLAMNLRQLASRLATR